MTWQRSGNLARHLRAKGMTSIAIGDLSEEWYLYAIAHPVHAPRDVFPNILRYYPYPITQGLVQKYKTLSEGASVEEAERLMGEILSDGQVHVPVRMFVRDFYKADFPVMRYEIRWTPEQVRPKGETGTLGEFARCVTGLCYRACHARHGSLFLGASGSELDCIAERGGYRMAGCH